jgi:hypothetical protein
MCNMPFHMIITAQFTTTTMLMSVISQMIKHGAIFNMMIITMFVELLINILASTLLIDGI